MADNLFSQQASDNIAAPSHSNQWKTDELAKNELNYLSVHNQLAYDVNLVYQADGTRTESAIRNQMTRLGHDLGGELSWISIVDPGKQTAQLKILDFAPDKTGADSQVSPEPPAVGDPTDINSPAFNKEAYDAKVAVCEQGTVPQAAELLKLSHIPEHFYQLDTIRENLAVGLPEDATYDQKHARDNEINAAQQNETEAQIVKDNALRDRREFRLPETATQEEVEAAQAKYNELRRSCG